MLNPQEIMRVREAIRDAETQTSGEIRVCVSRRCKGNPLDAAAKKFHILKMENTRFRNGVLIFVCPESRKAAIFGDKGIHGEAVPHFWDEALREMMSRFRLGEIAGGICSGVAVVGALLKEKYPHLENDVNELSDEIIMDDEA